MHTNSTLALSGVRVLDLSRVLAGPLCTMMLGDLGARVIKIERTSVGDDTRGWGPPFDEAGTSAYFLSVNRNKLSVAASLGEPDDRATILSLIADSDVVVENYLPSVLSRYGIDSGAILAQNKRLVWCTISGFGPGSRRPGYDFVVQAEAGWMSITGPVVGEPTKVGVALADVIAGKDAVIGILAALVGRLTPGTAQQRHIEVSLFRSAVSALVNVAQNALVSGHEASRWGNAHPNLVPYQLFETSDKPIVLAVGTDAQWIDAVKAMGLDHLATDVGLRTNAGRVGRRASVVRDLAERFRTDTAAVWIARLQAVGVPCGIVKGVLEALADVGALPSSGIEPSAGGSVRLRPPRLDEHGSLVRKFGWSAFDHVPILP